MRYFCGSVYVTQIICEPKYKYWQQEQEMLYNAVWSYDFYDMTLATE